MLPHDVYVKTERGIELLRAHKDSLPHALRIAFFMIDGHSTADDLLNQLSGLGVTPEAFDQLLAAGCIAIAPAGGTAPPPAAATVVPEPRRPAPAPAPPAAWPSEDERFRTAKQFLNETAVNASGMRGFFFTLKLEKCNSLQDLRELLPDYSKLMLGSAGKLEADVLIRRARELLSDRGPARSDPRTR